MFAHRRKVRGRSTLLDPFRIFYALIVVEVFFCYLASVTYSYLARSLARGMSCDPAHQ